MSFAHKKVFLFVEDNRIVEPPVLNWGRERGLALSSLASRHYSDMQITVSGH